jgi:putative N-acetylmannosamine-6-phosphate epimerase
MARAAAQGGASGIRANGSEDIRAIKAVVDLPIIGILKRVVEGYDVYITPDLDSARSIAEAGADVIAVDATDRSHPEGSATGHIVKLKSELGLPVMADVATLHEGVLAARAGADYVATTLSGYTPTSPVSDQPDLKLVGELVQALDVPVIAEGRFWTPEQIATAFELGARAVVVGTAITNPREITRRFAAAVPSAGHT